MKKTIYLIAVLTAILLTSNQVSAQLTTDNGWIYFKNPTQGKLYAGNSSFLLNSYNSNTTSLWLRDKEGELHGKLHGTGNGSDFGLVDGDGDWGLLMKKDTYIAFKINNDEKMRIEAGGDVGMGVTNPSENLHIGVPGRGGIRMDGDNTDDVFINIRNGNARHYIFDDQSDGNALDIESDNDLAFNTNGNQERMRILKSGRVGIGANNPQQRLHVMGFIRSSYSNGASEYTEIGHGGSNAFVNAVGDGNLDFRHDNNTKMTVTSTGNVGIGTTSPDNKLDVRGIIRSNEIKVELGWSDYVFNKDYDVPTLEEEEQHIEDNGYLMGFESEEAMNGEIQLGDVSRRQQAKIEEIMLHLIDMKKELDVVKQENEELKEKVNELEQANSDDQNSEPHNSDKDETPKK